jgi:hypothetical protein
MHLLFFFFFLTCFSQLSVIVTYTWGNQLIWKKGLFWLLVSEVSIHGSWPHGQTVCHRKCTVEGYAQFMAHLSELTSSL